jgi:nucleotide-binding universal stress UspA family protein
MRGISAAEHLMFGSTTERVLRSATLPVLVVPGSWSPPQPDAPDLAGLGPVVAAVELSEPALQAAAAAARLAVVLRTGVEALHVIPAFRVLNRWQAAANEVVAEREKAAARDLEMALRGLEPPVPIGLRVETGHVAQTIAAAVAPSGGRRPLLVIGRRNEASGATAYRILSLASAPVLQYVPQVE